MSLIALFDPPPLCARAGYPGPELSNTASLRASGKWKGLAMDSQYEDHAIPAYKE